MKKLLYITLLFVCFSIMHSQSIEINVRDNHGKAVEDVNSQLITNGVTIDFQKTDEKGKCLFNIPQKGSYQIKLTSVFYKTKFVEFNSEEQSSINITLESQITEIQEVKIKSRPKIATEKEDTISFNVKAIRDGTERTTEDLIKKLPGLDISESGKVTYKGNTVGQVLVNGNDFFGKNHKMATQNLSADMIEGVDLWKNYTTISGNSITAINLKLKEEYKGKITGNITANYGNKDSYLGHANVFKIGNVGNLASLADANNIAKDPISFMDFYEINTQDDIDNTNDNSDVEVPSFLNNDGKVHSKSNQFGAVQYSKSKRNYSITLFSIFNNTQLSKLSSGQRTVFDEQPQNFNFSELKRENNKGFIGTTKIKFKKNFLDKSFIYYSFGYNPTDDNFNQNINRISAENQFYEIKNKVTNNNLANYLSWNKQISDTKLILALSQINENYSGKLGIVSNENLFLTNRSTLFQEYSFDSNRYNFDFYLKNKNKWLSFNFHSGFSYKNDGISLTESATQSFEKQNLEIYHYINAVDVIKQFGKFNFALSFGSHLLDINAFNKHYFEKNIKIKYTPDAKTSTEFGLEYLSRYQNPSLKLLQENPLYSKELTSYSNIELTSGLLSNTEGYKFSWSKFNMDKGNLLFLILMYEKNKPTFTTNTINYGKFSEIENVIGRFKDRLFLLVSNDQRLNSNFILKTKFTGVLNKNINFISSNENIASIKTLDLTQKLSSNFKNKILQFDIGYTITKNIFEQSLYQTSTSQQNIRLSLGLRSNYRKEWIGNIIGEYLLQKTAQNQQNNFLVGGQLSYKKTDSNFEYNILFNNILNLNSFSYINSFTNQLGTDEYSTMALHGYVMGGIKCNF